MQFCDYRIPLIIHSSHLIKVDLLIPIFAGLHLEKGGWGGGGDLGLTLAAYLESGKEKMVD